MKEKQIQSTTMNCNIKLIKMHQQRSEIPNDSVYTLSYSHLVPT